MKEHTAVTALVRDEHSDMVKRLLKPEEKIMGQMTARKAQLLHISGAIASEAGELFDPFKKHCIFGKELDVENVIEELGDLEFYIRALIQVLTESGHEVTDEIILAANMKKLGVRHSTGTYTDEGQLGRADKVQMEGRANRSKNIGTALTDDERKMVNSLFVFVGPVRVSPAKDGKIWKTRFMKMGDKSHKWTEVFGENSLESLNLAELGAFKLTSSISSEMTREDILSKFTFNDPEFIKEHGNLPYQVVFYSLFDDDNKPKYASSHSPEAATKFAHEMAIRIWDKKHNA